MNNKNYIAKEYSLPEELFNSISHGIGALLGMAAVPIMMVFCKKNPMTIVSLAIYGFSIVMLYMMSTLYHALTNPTAKKVFKRLDHSSIYLLIAGTYTPICLGIVGGALGWTVFGIIWAAAIAGISLYSVFGNKVRKLNLITYVIMGWMVFMLFKPFYYNAPLHSFRFLILGGILYSIGVPFYMAKNAKWTHGIFHAFVLAGSIMHFFCIYTAFA